MGAGVGGVIVVPSAMGSMARELPRRCRSTVFLLFQSFHFTSKLPAGTAHAIALVMLCLATAQASADTLPPLDPADTKLVIREIKAMIKTDESGVDHFVVREATPERIERLFAMPEFLQQPKNIRENGLIFAGQGSLLSFDRPSDVINKVSAWFPREVAAARASKEHSFFTHLHLYGPFINWNAESAAFLGLWNCMPQIAWLKPQVNPFRKRGEDGGLPLLSVAARSSNTEEFDFGFCLRNRNGRRGAWSPDDARASQEEIRRTADKVTPILSDKFARYLSSHRCRGTGPDDCVLVLHLWAGMSPADAKLAQAIQMLEPEIAPDSPLPALHAAVNRNAAPSEEEYLRLDGALRHAAFLRAKLLSVLNGGAAWAPQALPATLHQMTVQRGNMGAAMDWRFSKYELEYYNESINPWRVVASNFGKSAQLREAVLAEIDGLPADTQCGFYELWFKTGGASMQNDYVLQRWAQGQPARCAAPDWAWLKKGETAEARDMRTRYLALLGQGDMDEVLLSNFTGNGEDCFAGDASPERDWLRKICALRISEPQKVSRQLARSGLALSEAEQFNMTPMPPPALADGDVTAEQGKWLMRFMPGLGAEAAMKVQAYADDLRRRNVHITSAKLWSHPRHASSLLELQLRVNEDSHVLLVVEPQALVTVEVPPRFRVDGYLRDIAYVSDLDEDGHLELWWAEARRCQGDMSDLERDLDCTSKAATMGEMRGRVLSYFSRNPAATRKPAPSNVAKAGADQTCNAILVGTVLADSLALDFGGGEVNGGRGDVMGVVCKPHPLHPEQTIVALFHHLKDGQGAYLEDRKGFVFAVIDVARKKLHRLYRDTIEEDAGTRVHDGSLQIDTARYNLAPGVRALGVRMNISDGPRCAEGGEDNYLTLFVEEGKTLRPVLMNQAMSSWSIVEGGGSCGYGEGDGDADYITENVERTLAVSGTTTNGWHDLELVAHHRIEKTGATGVPVVQRTTEEALGKFRASGKDRFYTMSR